jgi:S-adenosylmethionine hydrolase
MQVRLEAPPARAMLALLQAYDYFPTGTIHLALVGSRGLLEIAVNGGSAQRALGLRVGTPVIAILAPAQP